MNTDQSSSFCHSSCNTPRYASDRDQFQMPWITDKEDAFSHPVKNSISAG